MDNLTQPIRLEYAFPDIGTVATTLHKESVQLYETLQSRKEIERLEHLDHLGKLRTVHKTAHYSRWEYVILQLYFTDQLKEASETQGLSARVELAGNVVSSGEELIKCWVLLLNYCHLEGIFDTERVWLEILLDESAVRQTFFACLPSDESRRAADKILKSEDFYSLHKLFGLVFLEHERRKDRGGHHPWALWISMLEATLVNNDLGSKLSTCWRFFARIRKLVFVALDINHCPLGIRINPSLLLSKVKEEPDQFLGLDDSHFREQLSSLEKILYRNVYASEGAVRFRQEYQEGQRALFRALVKKKGTQFFSTRDEFCQRLLGARRNDFGKQSLKGDYATYYRAEFLPESVFPHAPVKCHTLEQSLVTLSRLKSWRLVVTPTAHDQRSRCVIDVLAPRSPFLKDEASACWTILQCIKDYYYHEYRNLDSGFWEAMAERELCDLAHHLMRRFLKPEFRVQIVSGTSPTDRPVVCLFSGSEVPRLCKLLGREIKQSNLAGDRKLELMALRKTLRNETRGSFLIALSNIKVFDQGWKSVAEFDGVYFKLQRRSLSVCLVESKRGIQRRSEKARKALDKKVKDAIKKPGAPKIVKCKGFAYTTLNLC